MRELVHKWADQVARRHISRFHRQYRRKCLSVFSAITAQREIDAFEKERRETATLRLSLHIRTIWYEHVHAVDERLALPALTTTHIKFSILAHFLRAGQGLERRHDITTRIACHHHVECVHRLEIVTLSKTIGAGSDDHLIDGGRPLVHHYMKTGQLAGGQRVVLKAEKRDP